MAYDIIVGRDDSDRKKYGKESVVFLGKSYVKMGQNVSLSNNVYLDVNRSHTVMLCGKKGSGKSYSLGAIAEEMVSLPKEIKDKLSVLIFDTMGIFWTMKYANTKEEDLLDTWNLKPKQLKDIQVFIPEGSFEDYKKKGMDVDKPFSIKPSELKGDDWCNVFGISLNEPLGILIERTISSFKKNFTIQEIIEKIKVDEKSNQEIKNAAENRFLAASKWGLFSEKGTEIKELVSNGKVSVLDVSCYTGVYGVWGIRSLVIGLISRKLFEERMKVRKKEELEKIKGSSLEKKKKEMPNVWILIDEAAEFLPKNGKTAATDSLIQVIREGRQPGISLILATQQPGEIHNDVITQSDIIISHRLTAKNDIEALNNMMQTYLVGDIQKYLNDLPDLKGSAVILDDNSERMYPIRVRPKFTWHGGEAPTVLG